MFEILFVGFGFMCLLTSLIAAFDRFDDMTRLSFAAMSMVMWIVWALQAGDIHPNSGGDPNTFISLMIVGVLWACIMGISVFFFAFGSLGGD